MSLYCQAKRFLKSSLVCRTRSSLEGSTDVFRINKRRHVGLACSVQRSDVACLRHRFEGPHEHDCTDDLVFAIVEWIRVDEVELGVPYHVELQLAPLQCLCPYAVEYNHELLGQYSRAMGVSELLCTCNLDVGVVDVCKDVSLVVSNDEYVPKLDVVRKGVEVVNVKVGRNGEDGDSVLSADIEYVAV